MEHLSPEAKQKFMEQTFLLGDKDNARLHDFYYVLLRVIEITTGLCSANTRGKTEEELKQDNLYADTNYNKGMVHARFLELIRFMLLMKVN